MSDVLAAEPDGGFDFKAHEQTAVGEYFKRFSFYQQFAAAMGQIVEAAIAHREIKVHSVQARAKEPSSLGAKASQPSDDDPRKPKYVTPLKEITDLAGVRVITYFPGTLEQVDRVLREELVVVERSDKGAELVEEERFGYQSIHYLVKLSPGRAQLPEYSEFGDVVAEIQVRTILQHAWAEIEHDIQYKSVAVIPRETHRRFASLAGLLEIADREFQAIQEADRRIKEEARTQVEAGNLEQVEITTDALKTFLDKRLGTDGRISEFSYDWTTRLLKRLGFRTLEQVDRCVRGFDDSKLSRIATGSRQGQTTRFELMLLAGMGEGFIARHLFANEPWYGKSERFKLESFKKADVQLRSYDPSAESPGQTNPEGGH